MASSKVGRRSLAYLTALATILALAIPFVGTASASHGGATNTTIDVTTVALTPDTSAMQSGSCVTFTATATSSGQVAESETLDITVTLSDTDAVVDGAVTFCDPDAAGAGVSPTTTPSGAGAAAPGPLTDSDDEAGGSAFIHGACVTTANGTCVFGVQATDTGTGVNVNNLTGTVTAFADINNNDTQDPSEPFDTSNVTVGPGGGPAVTTIACTPETQTVAEGGTTANFTCTATGAGGQPIQGASITMDVITGPNAEEITNTACGGGTTNAQGVTTCAYADPGANTATSPPGTDTVAFCVQQAASPGGTATPGCDAHEAQDTDTVNWVGNANNVVCTPDGATVTPGSNILFNCAATDVNNNAVGAGVTITMSKTSGPGIVTGGTCSDGTETTTATSNSCTLQITTSTNETGTITVTGSISGAGTNCTAGTPPTPNAGTTAVCTDTGTASVQPATVPPQEEVSHDVTVSITRMRHARVGGRRFLLVRGNVASGDFESCSADRVVLVQIRAGGAWVNRKSDTTDENSGFAVLIQDVQANYRAKAPRIVIEDPDNNRLDICQRDNSPRRRHSH